MLKKRLIFSILYDQGNFVLSRNFRLQKVGDLKWLKGNYNFSKIAFFIDELLVLDVSREQKDFKLFCEVLSDLSKSLFVPVSAGGGISSLDQVKQIFRSGADKIVLNSALLENQKLVREISYKFGRQSIIGSLDFKKSTLNQSEYQILYHGGSKYFQSDSIEVFKAMKGLIGEWYINSIDRDGTGQGYDFGILDYVYPFIDEPIIYAGGVGNVQHLSAGLSDARIDGVATANLFNFIDDGFKNAKLKLIEMGYELTDWKFPDSFEFINEK